MRLFFVQNIDWDIHSVARSVVHSIEFVHYTLEAERDILLFDGFFVFKEYLFVEAVHGGMILYVELLGLNDRFTDQSLSLVRQFAVHVADGRPTSYRTSMLFDMLFTLTCLVFDFAEHAVDGGLGDLGLD